MAKLHIHLQRGFEEDRVVVEIAGKKEYNQSEVTTSLLTGLADSFEVEVPDSVVPVFVHLPGRDLRTEIEVDVAQEVYLGLSVEGGRIVPRISEEEFGYM